METYNLEQMTKGWFIGNFEPTAYVTEDVEVGIKKYKKGDSEATHYHKIATEFTIVISGKVKMNGKVFSSGEIIKINPLEKTDFKALEDSVTTVVKIPGAPHDKYQ